METNKSKSGFVTVYGYFPVSDTFEYLNMRVADDRAWFEDIHGNVRFVNAAKPVIFTVTQMRRARRKAVASLGETSEWSTPGSVRPFIARKGMTLVEAVFHMAKVGRMDEPEELAANTTVQLLNDGTYRLTKGA